MDDCLFTMLTTLNSEGNTMELADIRNELENTAKRLADFRGSL